MKLTQLLQLFSFLLISSPLVSQEPVKIEKYDKNWNETESSKPFYRREFYQENDTLLLVKDYKGKKLEMTGYYKSTKIIVENGVFTFYDKKGNLTNKTTYKNGELKNSESSFLGKSTVLNYDFYLEYDESGGSVNDLIPMLDKIGKDKGMPSFQGGDISKFRFYLATNIRYPRLALKYKKTGTVYVNFEISNKGEVENVRVCKPLHKDLDKEAMRVMRDCPNWNPAIVNGQPEKTKLTIPIVFVLE